MPPTYEYECLKCNERFEKFQSIKDEPLKKCPQCRGNVRRLIGGGAGLLFKGSGFYITDYRSEGYKQAARADSTHRAEAKTPAASGTEKKTPSKSGKGKSA